MTSRRARAVVSDGMLSLRGESATSSVEGDTMAKQASLTRVLLACGVVGGPMYVTVTSAS